MVHWLVVSTHLKNISQNGKNVSNHQLERSDYNFPKGPTAWKLDYLTGRAHGNWEDQGVQTSPFAKS